MSRAKGLSRDKGAYQLPAPPQYSNPYLGRLFADITDIFLHCFFSIIDCPIKFWSSRRSSRLFDFRHIVSSWSIEVPGGWRAIKALIAFSRVVFRVSGGYKRIIKR